MCSKVIRGRNKEKKNNDKNMFNLEDHFMILFLKHEQKFSNHHFIRQH